MDGEEAGLAAVFDDETLAVLEKEEIEAVNGAANATRTQNPCDAGGVFFSTKTMIRSGKYEEDPDPGVKAFLNQALQNAPLTIQTRDQYIDFLAMSKHIWPPAHDPTRCVRPGWFKTGLAVKGWAPDSDVEPLDFDQMVTNLGPDVNKSISPEEEKFIRASLVPLEFKVREVGKTQGGDDRTEDSAG